MWRGRGSVVAVLSLYWYLVGSSVVLRGRGPGGRHAVPVVILRSVVRRVVVLHGARPLLLPGHVGRTVVLLELAGPLSVKSLLVMSHVVLVTDRALVVLVVVVLLLLSGLAHVSIIGPVTVVMLVRLLVDIRVLLSTVHTVVWRLGCWSLNLQLPTGIQNLKNVKL